MAKKKKDFWNKEYAEARSFALSDEPAEDLIKFTRFLMRKSGKGLLNVTRRALDVGCGNGRNLLYLGEQFGMHGLGYDLSSEAIAQARATAEALNSRHRMSGVKSEKPQLEFRVQALADSIPLPDNSVMIALDMMASHVLRRAEREALRAELFRVLKPGGWLLFKSFLLEDDQNAERMLEEYPGPEEGMYLHPRIKVAEYVWPNVEAVEEFYVAGGFSVQKTEKSFKHVTRAGKPWKRRSVIAYLEKS